MNILSIVCGFSLMAIGSYLLVNGASNLARTWGVSEMTIGVTIVAFGTSLPELCTVVYASSLGKHDIGLGNVIGSNILNILGVLGLAALILPITLNRSEVSTTTVVAFVVTSLYVLFCLLIRNQITRWDGLMLVATFVLFNFLTYNTKNSS